MQRKKKEEEVKDIGDYDFTIKEREESPREGREKEGGRSRRKDEKDGRWRHRIQEEDDDDDEDDGRRRRDSNRRGNERRDRRDERRADHDRRGERRRR